MILSQPRFVFLLLLLFVLGCKPEPLDPSKDPCEDAVPFTADFQILEILGDSLVETDKVLMFSEVQFSTRKRYRSYTWYIGGDSRVFTDPSVRLRFNNDALGLVTVTLIATTNEINSCFPDDNKIDTLTKSFSVISWDKAPIIGKYRGIFEREPNEKQVVEVRYISPLEDIRYEPYGGFQLININKGCNLDVDPYFWDKGAHGAYAMSFGSPAKYYNGCLGPEAWLSLFGKDTLSVEFSTGTLTTPSQRTDDSFVGIRF